MADSGIFRTSVFGGFNKNDVLKYFDDIKRNSAGEMERLTQTNAELNAKVDELEAACVQKDEDIKTVISELTQTESKLEKIKSLADENELLKSQLAEMSAKASQADEYKTRCEQLSYEAARSKSDNDTLQAELDKVKSLIKSFEHLDFNALKSEIATAADNKAKLEYELCKMRDTLGSLNVGINNAKSHDDSMTKSLSSLINMVELMKNTVSSAGESVKSEGTEL